MIQTEFYLQHGWAFDASCWRSWRHAQEVSTIADRGYFGETAVIPMFQLRNTYHVLAAHSFGLHLVPPSVFSQTDLLVVLGGFEQFAASSRRVIKRMENKLCDDATAVICDFYKNCFGDAASPAVPQIKNLELLKNDLAVLADSRIDLSLLRAIPQILILHGDKDRIVSAESACRLHDSLEGSRLVFCAGGEHAFPFTHTGWCLQQIAETIEIAHRPLMGAVL